MSHKVLSVFQIIFTLGGLSYLCDLDGRFRKFIGHGWDHIFSNHPALFYYCLGNYASTATIWNTIYFYIISSKVERDLIFSRLSSKATLSTILSWKWIWEYLTLSISSIGSWLTLDMHDVRTEILMGSIGHQTWCMYHYRFDIYIAITPYQHFLVLLLLYVHENACTVTITVCAVKNNCVFFLLTKTK